MKRLLQAQWVAPMDGPILRDAAVVFSPSPQREEGRGEGEAPILAIGPATELRQAHPDAEVHDYGKAMILPGLINAHTHLELSDSHANDPPSDFVSWLKRIIARRAAAGADMESVVKAAVAKGIEQCLRFGVTTVGDITRSCAATREAIHASPLRAVSYGEVQALGQRRELLHERLEAASDRRWESAQLKIGLTPHAPYTVEEHAYRACLVAAKNKRMPLATHLAENPFEDEFLSNNSGPFRELWDSLGWWDDRVPKFQGGPIRFAQAIGLLNYPTLLAHVNYCDNEELEILAKGCASVVFCPRTHRYFDHPPHRWREMLLARICVAVGTDSTASSPDLNIVEELRLLHRQSPQVPVEVLWRMITTLAAKAIQMDHEVGRLTPGRRADATVFRVHSSDPLKWILQNNVVPRDVWVNGQLFPSRA